METAAAKINILLACEESQTVCAAFRARGFNAWSCDILPSSGAMPQYHIQDNVQQHLAGIYRCRCGNFFPLHYGKYGCCGASKIEPWHCIISFPPCTHLSSAGAHRWKQKQETGQQQAAINFFFDMYNAPAAHIAVENPCGIINTKYMKPSQIIHPYYFGDPHKKRTCLWLRNLPPLVHTRQPDLFLPQTHTTEPKPLCIDRSGTARHYTDYLSGTNKKARSKTFPAIATAMAQQWGDFLLNQYTNP